MKKTRYLFLATGGTGGHVFPAIATADYLQASDCKVGISFDHRCAHLFTKDLNLTEKLILSNNKGGKNITALLNFFFHVCSNCYKAIFYFVRKRPKAILAFGGYSTFPILLAATILRIPIFLHEQNTVLGRVNSLFLPVAKKLFLSFPLKTTLPSRHIISGLPIRKEIFNAQVNTKSIKNRKFKLTIMGGSQGAAIFCKIIPKTISLLSSNYQAKIELCMQVRQEFYSDISSILNKTKCIYRLEVFIANIADIYRNSDLIITRAGGSSLAEICTVKQAAIIVPLPSAKDNHQYFNAQEIVKKNSLIVQKQDDFTEQWLRKVLTEFIDDSKKIREIKNSLQKDCNVHRIAVAKIIKAINYMTS